MKNSEQNSTTKKIWTTKLNEREYEEEIKCFLRKIKTNKWQNHFYSETQVLKEKTK